MTTLINTFSADGTAEYPSDDPRGQGRYPMHTFFCSGSFGGGILTIYGKIKPIDAGGTEQLFPITTVVGTGTVNVTGHYDVFKLSLDGSTNPSLSVWVN